MLRNRRKIARKKNTRNVRNQHPVKYASGNNDFIVTSDSSWESECSIMETTDYSDTSSSISFSNASRRNVPRMRQRLPSQSTKRKKRTLSHRQHRGGNDLDVAGPSHSGSSSCASRNTGNRSIANKRKRKEKPTILDSEVDSSDYSFSRLATRTKVKRLRPSVLDSDDSDSSVIRSLSMRQVNGTRITLALLDESESSSPFSDSENVMPTTMPMIASNSSPNSSTSSFSSSSFCATSASSSSTGPSVFSSSVFASFIDSDSHLASENSCVRCSTKLYASAREQILSSDSDSSDHDGEKCAICLKKFRTQQIGNPLNCDHHFCFKCLEEWSKSSNTCPVDRSTFEAILVRHEIGGSVVDRIEVQSRNLTAFAADVEEILINEIITCELCGSGDDEETLLLCDLCNLGYHMACLNPPLHVIPAHSWYCPPCQNLHQNSESNLMNEVMRRLVSNLSPLALSLPARRSGRSRVTNTRQNTGGPPPRGRGPTFPRRIRNHSVTSNTVNSLEQGIEEFHTELKRCMSTTIRKKRRSRRTRNRNTNVASHMNINVAERSSLQDGVSARLDVTVLRSTGPASRPSEIVDLVFPNFSLFGNDDLTYFSDEANDETYNGEVAIMARVRSEYSARRIENRKNLVSSLINPHHRISTTHSTDLLTTENISSSSNLLDSILESQTLWHSKNVEISSKKDGTLEVKLKKDDGKPDLSNSNHSSKEIPLFPNKSASSSSETNKSYANNTRYSSFSGNSNSNSSSFSQSTSSFNSLNPPPRPGFSSILGTNSAALDLSPFRGAAPIRFRMNPPRPTLRRNYNNSNSTRLAAGTNLVQSSRKPNSQSGVAGDDEVDLYDDIDTETPEPEKAIEMFSSLEPPPEPPALLIGSDTSSDEDSGLVIDDKALIASRCNIYDPNEPTNEDSDAESKNVNCRPEYMRSPSYGGISEFGPHLPLPEPPALPAELESVNSESEEEADCPNMNLYSHTSICLANNVQDIPIPESDYPSVIDEVLECIPVPTLTSVPKEDTLLPVEVYNSPPMIPIFSAEELYSPSKKMESESDVSVQDISDVVPQLKKLVSNKRSPSRHTSSERDSSPDVEERRPPRRRRKRFFVDDDRNKPYRRPRSYSSAEERIRSYLHSSSDDERVRSSRRSSREHLRVRKRSRSRRRNSRTIYNMRTRSLRRSSRESSGNDNVSFKDSIHTIISDESSAVSDTPVDETVISDLLNVCDTNSVNDCVDRVEVVNAVEVDKEPKKDAHDEIPTVETEDVTEKCEGGDKDEDGEIGNVGVEETTEQFQVIDEDGAEKDLVHIGVEEYDKSPQQEVEEQVANGMPNDEDISKVDKNDSSEVVAMNAYLLPSDDLDPVSDVEYNDFTDVLKIYNKEGKKKRKKARKRASPIPNQSIKGERELEEGELEDEKSSKLRILSRKRRGSKSPARISDKKQKSKKDRKDKGPGKENKDTSKNESDPLWKKLSKSTKERNYRDGKARPVKLPERNKKRVSNAKKKEKRKEMERYDVRKVVSEKPKTVKDEFGRDISPPRTRSRSPSIARSYSGIRRSKGPHRRSASPDDRWINWSPVWTQRKSRSRNRKSRSRERNRSRLSSDRYRNRSKGELRESRKRRRSMSSVARYSPVENKRKKSKEKQRRSDSYNVRLSHDISDYYYERSWTRSPSLYASLTPDPEPYINRYERSPSNLEPNRIPVVVTPEPRLLSQNPKNLTVIVPNVEATKKKRKKKKDGKKKKKKQPSKEVFTSGDNIVVSVNFDDNQKTISSKSSKRKHDGKTKKKKNVRKRRKQTLHVSEEVLNAKPVAVIDLNISPCKELSSLEVISLTDSGDEGNVNDKTAPANRHLTNDTNTYIITNAGPKTPPEPSIKFIVSSTVPLRACVPNPIFEPDEELDREVNSTMHFNKGPNTPPEPSAETLSATMYDPFEPTKSRSVSPVNVDGTTFEERQCIDIFADDSEKISECQTNDKSQEENNEGSVASMATGDETQTTKPSPAREAASSETLNGTMQNTNGNTLVLDLSSLGDDFVPKSTIPLVKTSQGKYEFQSGKTPDRPITVVISQQSVSKPQPQQVMVTPTRQVSTKPVEPIKQPMFPDILPWKLPPLSQASFATPPAAVSTVTSTTMMTQSKSVSSINQNGGEDDLLFELDDSPYSPASSEDDDLFEPPPLNSGSSGLPLPSVNLYKSRVDSLFNSSPVKKPMPRSNTYTKPRMKKKLPKPIGGGKKDVGIRADEEQLKILDDVPNSAVEMIVKEKFLKKLHRQERVVEEVKVVLKPHYAKKHITKEDYKDILRRAVPKICHNKTGDINPSKIQGLVEAYIRKIRHSKKKVTNLNTLPGSTNAPLFPNMTNAVKPKKQKNIWS